MGWEEYTKKLGIKHQFSEFGCKEFWVKLRRLDSFPYGEAREPGGTSPEELEEAKRNPQKAAELRDKFEEDLIKCILDWHITDPTIQDGPDISEEERIKSMSIPTVGDKTSLTKLPLEFIVAMMEWLNSDSEVAKKVPKMIGTSSGQP